MSNPYQSQPDRAFWSRSVARLDPDDVDPVGDVPFHIHADDQVATAGSCFAQHISRALQARGFPYLITEPGPIEQNYGVYPARFGNIYTARQLVQLFQRAFGLFSPQDTVWERGGAFFDPFRPQIETGGFATPEDLHADRETHLAAVRRMFETADVLIFTLGLTEGWVSSNDGAVVPLAPGVVAEAAPGVVYNPHNFSVQETVDDLRAAIRHARVLRPDLKIILTVSPVPLIATIGSQHVLSATAYSKAILRVAAEMVSGSEPAVAYFPSYEMITGAHNGSRFLADDLRTVLPEGVAQVMSAFARHYLTSELAPAPQARPHPSPERLRQNTEVGLVICDEEVIDR
jgi:hypothetical protein